MPNVDVSNAINDAILKGVSEWAKQLHHSTMLFVNTTPEGYNVTWMGYIRDSISLEEKGSEFILKSDAEYFHEVSERDAPSWGKKPFYEGGALTVFGQWAIDTNKLGFEEVGDGIHLRPPNSKKQFDGLHVFERDAKNVEGPGLSKTHKPIIGLDSWAYEHHRPSLLQDLKQAIANSLPPELKPE